MRVLVDASSITRAPSGARTRIVHLLRASAALRGAHDVIVLATQESGLHDEFAGTPVEVSTSQAPPPPWRRFLRGPAFHREHLRATRADVLQAETLPVPPDPGVPLLLTLHDLRDIESDHAPAARRLYAVHVLPRAMARVARVLAVSRHTARLVHDRLGVARERIDVVPNAPDPDVAPLEPSLREPARLRLGLQRPFVLALGHLERRKNLDVLLDAAAILRGADHGMDVEWVFAGRDREGEGPRLLARARALGVPLRVLRDVSGADRDALLSLAEVTATPSVLEGFGLVPLEAGRAGSAPLAAASGALPEVCGDAIPLLDPRDARAWADAIGTLLRDPRERARIAQAARARADAYTWEAAARALHAAYDAVAAARAGGA